MIGVFEYLSSQSEWDAVVSKLQGAAGVSSGCIVALALLIGADFKALAEALVELSGRFDSIAATLDVQLVIDSYGLDDGKTLQLTIDAMLNAIGLSTTTTFSGLRRLTKKDFRVCAVNMQCMKQTYFSYQTTPQMLLRDALYMSMTIPFIFKPRRWMGELYVDGGLLENFPVEIFGNEVVPFLIYLDWNPPEDVSSLRSFAYKVAVSTIHLQIQQFQKWVKEHSDSVQKLCDPHGDQEIITLDCDSDNVKGMRRRGYISGMLCQRKDVAALMQNILLMVMRAPLPTTELTIE